MDFGRPTQNHLPVSLVALVSSNGLSRARQEGKQQSSCVSGTVYGVQHFTTAAAAAAVIAAAIV